MIGRIVLEGTPETPVDWTHNEPAVITAGKGVRFASNIDKDGRFCIDDVPTGRHTLDVSVNAPTAAGLPGPGKVIAQVKTTCAMPEIAGGRSNEPLNLGTIQVKLKAPRGGDLAPDFDVERVTGPEMGRRLRLALTAGG